VKISSLLDGLSDLCRSYLADKNLPTIPVEFNHSEGVLCRVSTSICDFLWERGFGAAERELQTDLSIVH
jgi:F-box protein 21